MATTITETIQVKQGLETNRGTNTFLQGELAWTTDKKRLYIGDGATAGGLFIGPGLFNKRVAKTATYAVLDTDYGNFFEATSGTWSLTLTAAATLGAGFCFAFFNSGSGVITIDPNASETIRDMVSSATTKTFAQGEGGIILCDGTGFTLLKFANFDSLSIHSADVASASTLNLDACTGDLLDVTGTTTVTAVTLAEGKSRTVRFTGALVLTHGSSLVLPGAANITTVAGDYATFRGYAAGVVRCVHYQRNSGQALIAGSVTLDSLTVHGSDVASAATLNLDTATGDLIDVTGTTAITAITLTEGRSRTVRFTGALTLTHNSVIILPSGASVTTAAGDYAMFRGYAAGVVRCVGYSRASGQALVGGSVTLDSLTVHGADIASASTVNLDSATGDLVDVTGTTAMTAITLTEGRWRTVRFTGILTLTHGSSLLLPGAANITTAAGDFAIFRGYAAGVVRCVSYQKVSGAAVVAGSTTLDALTIHGADIASASTVNLDTATGDLVDVTGTTAITAITLTEGRWRTVRFTGALTLTNGASLLLPGAANITTAAGDFAIFRGYATGVVRCVGYTKLNGTAVVGAPASSALTSTSTGTQNDFSFSNASMLIMNNASLVTITGLAAGSDGQLLTIVSKGAGQVDINNQNAGSSAANRIINQVSATISLSPGKGSVMLQYDLTTTRWRVVYFDQGSPIAVAYSSGDYTATGGTWTVDSGDKTLFSYLLKGRILTIFLTLDFTSTTAGTTPLMVAIPGGFVPNMTTYQALPIYEITTEFTGNFKVISGDTKLYLYKGVGGPSFVATSNNLYLRGNCSFEVQ